VDQLDDVTLKGTGVCGGDAECRGHSYELDVLERFKVLHVGAVADGVDKWRHLGLDVEVV
jgi:hypothetical protein